MEERLLHHVWRYQLFNKAQLLSEQKQTINILKTGHLNHNAGPDFLQGKVLIDKIEWNGHIEIHVHSSDWNKHGHQHDNAYNNVILHVVWEDDKPVMDKDMKAIPTLVLSGKITKELLHSYKKLINTSLDIPCRDIISKMSGIIKQSQWEKALVHRLEQKGAFIDQLMKKANNHWELITMQLLAYYFGFKLNNDNFLDLIQSIPYGVIQKHRGNIVQLEALLFGQANLLTQGNNKYETDLLNEYQYLKKLHSISSPMSSSQWKRLRTHSPNFPHIRIAQLAMILHQEEHFFRLIKESISYKDLQQILRVSPSPFWEKHYDFSHTSKHNNRLGKFSSDNLIINVIVPMKYYYGISIDEHEFIEQGLDLLYHLPGENNKITRQFKALGLPCRSAYDSQAMIEQYKHFCLQRNCLSCSIGTDILRPS